MTDLRSAPACSMLFSASRTSSVPELQWPLGKDRESDWGRRKGEGKQGEELGNRDEEEEEGGLKREEEEDVGRRVEAGGRLEET